VNRKMLVIGGSVVALAAGGVGAGTALGGDDGGSPSGPAADQAREAALRHTGGGTANSVEQDGENGATWEVEVTKPDGKTVDVRLGSDYRIVTVEGDSEG